MFKNYFLIAVRNLMRHKLYSFINIGGLSIGLAACILIFLFVQNELSYDTWMKDNERIYRLETLRQEPGQTTKVSALSPAPMHAPLQRQFNDKIEASSRLFVRYFWVSNDEIQLEESINLVDRNFFEVFDLPVIAGDPQRAFEDFQSLVITESTARKYFADASPIGQTLELENGEIVAKVAAVIKDLPTNSHLNIDLIMQLDETRYDHRPFLLQWWMSANVHTYVKLRPGVETTEITHALPSFLDQYAIASPGPGYPADMVPSERLSINFMSVKDIHLHSEGAGQLKPSGDLTVIYGFSIIAALILVIAVINFTNLSTARSSLRAREVALRKVVGASRKQLIGQLLGETLVTTTIALFLALVLVEISLPWFNNMVVKLLSLAPFTDPIIQLGFVALAVVIGLSAGAHPAIALSSYRPASVLHSNSAAKSGSAKLRTALTTLQFTISIGLMIATGVIYSQIHYLQTMDVGFDKRDKLTLYHMTYGDVASVANTIKQEIDKLPGVNTTAFANRGFPIRGKWSPTVTVADRNHEGDTLRLEHVPGDYSLLEFFDAKLIAGRFFSQDFPSDLAQPPANEGGMVTQSGIINEAAVQHLGFASAADAVGKTIYISQTDDSVRATRIVGVVNNMQLRSARSGFEPTIFRVEEGPMWLLNVDLKPELRAVTLASIDAIWERLAADVPMDREFIQDRYEQFYQADKMRGEIFAYFSLFAILVSCLGLYGLASFATEQRTREIGVRKVLGAKVIDIVGLLTLQFSRPVLIANLIAWPAAWYFSNEWLQGFAHRIDLGISHFVMAGGLAILIASATVAGHAVRTAKATPITALRHE